VFRSGEFIPKKKRGRRVPRKKDRGIEGEKTALHNSKGRTRNLSSTNIYTGHF
jgi:hypothetical protein